MKFKVSSDKIEIYGKDDFCATHILECGQFFSFKKYETDAHVALNEHDENIVFHIIETENISKKCDKKHVYDVFTLDKKAEIYETKSGYEILTRETDYFLNFFDLQTDYCAIKKQLMSHEIMKRPIEFGSGIRILHQNLFETLISFIISANNNIKRIQQILWRIREKFGTDMGTYFAFPTHEQLLHASIDDFSALGAGYRSKYLFNVLRQVDENMLQDWSILSTKMLRSKLISLSGVGPKVADCILLFGYGRGDVFPVDTWMEKMYHHFYGTKKMSREQIREALTCEFGKLSGYAQQYLFYFMRSEKN